MKILIIGGGGREHALAWKISQSPLCAQLYVAPGNAGTQAIATNLEIKATDVNAIIAAIPAYDLDMVIIAPDDPLAMGLADQLESNYPKLIVTGPSAAGAKLESSKSYAKEFMQRHSIPTASSKTFESSELNEALEYVSNHSLPVVIKADGLAAGKGVIICETNDHAKETVLDMLGNGSLGAAGKIIVVEQFLQGVECSMFVLTDGNNYIMLPEAKDYKRRYENDEGPNTGGMGTVSPVAFCDEEFKQKVINKIIEPTINGLAFEKIDYRGFLFFGLINIDGEPFVIEYNARLGDPETQVILPRIKDDILPYLIKSTKRELSNNYKLSFDQRTAVCVIAVSDGYPGKYDHNKELSGLSNVENAIIFHAGTTMYDDKIYTNGGRVLGIVSLADNLSKAKELSYKGINTICYSNIAYRIDIGNDLIR
ncbi:MAG: phosphoribosylamine--glycine ligase [Bacteroidota bacterium]|nr:phosphoribosylamine--glycine ligase [Bacteroidota bacterium]